MSALAATATPETTLTGLLLLTLAVTTLGYGLGCWLYPFGACRRCHGTGKRRSPFGRAFGLCRRCHGDGRRLRIGRRIINALRELHDKGTR
ncbi:hypothetical protein EV385_0591 [Krasilnikovia cinnamomea]|uniref:Uncharacterized protein n=1 Tax=Krasilnikovia cinnamomea TaxID=349313 RepID=A0A4Q7ZDU2_9ACTN|nr:hypothetical protein [Krasilnikovia cinnamomea]RZU48862.1 hypothetical protein EV385_0591 [Krasilnikovia cinnamomea]